MKRHFRESAAAVWNSGTNERRGVFMVLAFFVLSAALVFVALSVDLGVVSLTKTQLQNAVDAAALAAAQEISAALEDVAGNVGEGGDVGGQVQDANAIAEDAARIMASHVAELNGVFVDPQADVRFGKRVFDESTGDFSIQWGSDPYNVVEVKGRRDNPDTDAPDGMLELFFAPFLGQESVALKASAISFVEARDLVVVLDFSGSMNYDSQLRSDSIDKLGQTAIEDNLYDIWQDLGAPAYGDMPFEPGWVTVPDAVADVTWKSSQIDVEADVAYDEVQLKFSNGNYETIDGLSATTGTYSGTGSNAGSRITKCWVTSGVDVAEYDFYDNDTIIRGLGLDAVEYPFPDGEWYQYVEYMRDHSSSMSSWYEYQMYATGYRRKFGTMTFLNFLFRHKREFDQTPVLWQTRHYPFHAVKEGTSLLCDFLQNLQFGDHMGMVSYDTQHRVESVLDDPGIEAYVDISSEPITNDYSALDTIQRHKQAAHYYGTTNIGGGLYDATQLLAANGRYGARPTILLMTDGNANTSDEGWSFPSNWDWTEMTDYDGDGTADYTTSDYHKQYTFYRAKQAIDMGITIHTMSVGANADRSLMQAIAYAGGGIWIDVPGGSTVDAMESQMLEAFGQIAANVPPAKLLIEPE